MRKDKKTAFWMGCIAAAFIASIAVFMVMLQMEKAVLTNYEKGKIYIASKGIPRGQIITAENEEEYLQQIEVDVRCIPDTALREASQITKLSASCDIEKGVLLTMGMFREQDAITAGMEEPVIAGFRAEDVCQVAGGMLRAGDCIHIYYVDEEGKARLKWSDITVQQVFDSSGRSIQNKDTETCAQRVNIYLDKPDVEEFYSEWKTGSLRVVKVCD
ncbi:MAG: hypothetical protein NC094_03115 [Bacteroidales bacterium]|nr:hypothetical protein [Lachnoclostridium sp.]MCM1383763.1 hypothetical protein [Lachnoclostridium sp.]MCM1464391.1 hypothetical protein [Bacteroidales bacterium]